MFGWLGSDSVIRMSITGTPDRVELLVTGDRVALMADAGSAGPLDREGVARVVRLASPATKADDVAKLMAGAKARYGMFDPPYGIAVIGGVLNSTRTAIVDPARDGGAFMPPTDASAGGG
jgi:hypothetical protein